MKIKKLLAALLAAASFSASAQVLYGVGAGFDYDVATSNRIGLETVTKASLLAGVRGKYGQLDGGLYEVHLGGEGYHDNIKGVELGYGPAFPIGKVQIATRAAVGKLFNRGLGAPETAYYRTFAVTAAYPLTDRISPFIAYRYRPGQDLDKQGLYTLGLNYAVSKQVVVQATYRQTRNATGPILNGVTTQVLFFF